MDQSDRKSREDFDEKFKPYKIQTQTVAPVVKVEAKKVSKSSKWAGMKGKAAPAAPSRQ